jgi:hypothetical protein
MCFNTYMPMHAFLWLVNCYFGLYPVKIGRAFEINNIQRDHITCDLDETQLSRSFGEAQPIFSDVSSHQNKV